MSNPKENGWSEVYRVRLPVTIDQYIQREAKLSGCSAPQKIADMVADWLTYRKILEPLGDFDHIKESILFGGERK